MSIQNSLLCPWSPLPLRRARPGPGPGTGRSWRERYLYVCMQARPGLAGLGPHTRNGTGPPRGGERSLSTTYRSYSKLRTRAALGPCGRSMPKSIGYPKGGVCSELRPMLSPSPSSRYLCFGPSLAAKCYRGTSLTRNNAPVGPYSSPMPRDLWCS